MITLEDREARFASLADACLEPVRRYLARRADAATAEDVLADVLLVCWRRLDEVPADAALPWAIGVARNQLRNAQRGVRRQERAAARLADEQRVAGGSPDVSALRDALGALRPADAELLRLWAWEGLQPADLAVALGISPNAAAIRLHRAKRRLADELGRTGP
ncbi:RNA polymerase sigma factor [uncultured Amnibacterium sp.]|uniref:RNA polymerase sigma factor n=1 Tax=uncultured Amnibacterium sp. TaxID=1631851 RepID=UPI0035CB6D35